MQIDWKYLVTTDGYKSLKMAYIHDLRKGWRNKAELLAKFYWVIGRAKHYANHAGKSMEAILNEWEKARNYWWLNFYQDCNQPKFRSNCMKRQGIKGIRKYYKNDPWYKRDPVRMRERIKSAVAHENRNKPKKEKPRWTMVRKKRGY